MKMLLAPANMHIFCTDVARELDVSYMYNIDIIRNFSTEHKNISLNLSGHIQ